MKNNKTKINSGATRKYIKYKVSIPSNRHDWFNP
jgi:hypothetical protein